MGKLIGLLLALGVGFGTYWGCFHKSQAYLAYLQWTAATATGDCKTLYAISDGEAKKWVDFFCTPQAAVTIMGQVAPGLVAANIVKDMHNSPQGIMMGLHHEIKSQDEASDGTVSLVVIESVVARPSNFNKPAPPRQHDVKVKEFGGVWKVIDFKQKDL